MSNLTISGLSDAAHRAMDKVQIPDSKFTRTLAVLIVLGCSAVAGLFALVALISALGGDLSSGFFSALVAVVVGAPAIFGMMWLDRAGDDQLVR